MKRSDFYFCFLLVTVIFALLQNLIIIIINYFVFVFIFYSQKASQGQDTKQDGSSASPLLNNSTMVYEGAFDQSEISWATCGHVFQSQAIAGIVSIAMAMWRLCQLF